ncbi:EEF1A lysine methyltransferase 2 isoform X2 [Ornithorhynchus anatinus]|uniref:EEF1A lysine methyltransferase 2 n=1 Tax=Ornithorhynchus anatinus TaxID=9258 RepID=A0A6I8NZQ3_ORNAN|nr:EEF1A lysine methyltransferase 2 isoform X2 [Ornithorhynchus anatinus]
MAVLQPGNSGMSGGFGVRGGPARPGPDSFSPSALGTRQHWDTTYERELQAFREYGDTGEIWFGEESVTRLIRWLERRRVPLDASVLDIGTGNGAFLVELAKSGFSNVTGIDYSPAAIQLSRSIIEKEGLANVKLQVEDFLNPTSALPKFGICVDKGTFDAISLNPDNPVEKRKRYVKSLSRVLETGGFFLITSCNWTKDELLREFSEGFEVLEELPTPKFLFGGRSGNSVTALVFRRKGGASPDGLGRGTDSVRRRDRVYAYEPKGDRRGGGSRTTRRGTFLLRAGLFLAGQNSGIPTVGDCTEKQTGEKHVGRAEAAGESLPLPLASRESLSPHRLPRGRISFPGLSSSGPRDDPKTARRPEARWGGAGRGRNPGGDGAFGLARGPDLPEEGDGETTERLNRPSFTSFHSFDSIY